MIKEKSVIPKGQVPVWTYGTVLYFRVCSNYTLLKGVASEARKIGNELVSLIQRYRLATIDLIFTRIVQYDSQLQKGIEELKEEGRGKISLSKTLG